MPAILLLLMAAHFLVDTMGALISPLWPNLEKSVGVNTRTMLWIFVVWNTTTSFSQLLFAYLGTRFRNRWFLWGGPAVACICMSCVGLVSSPVAMTLLLIAGGLGVAAFHPEAATAVGEIAPGHRSRVMSLFILGGFTGHAVSPYYSGLVTDTFALPGLALTIAWGLPCVGLVAFGLRKLPAASEPATPEAPSAAASGTGSHRHRGIILVLVIQTLRNVPMMGVPIILAYLLEARGYATAQVGLVQTFFLAGIGAGGLICAVVGRQEYELPILRGVPLVLAPLVVVIPYVDGIRIHVCVALTGAMLGIALPVMISFGQQVMPHGKRIASSLTLGVSWGFSGAFVAPLFLLKESGRWDVAFLVFAGTSIVSGLLAFRLPRLSGPVE